MKSITMTRRSSASDKPGNYRLDFTITSGNGITTALFVKERIILPTGEIDDTFVTVASPSQIEDIPTNNPDSGDIYFRDSSISLVSSDPTCLTEIGDNILADLQLTLAQATDLEDLSVAETITIDPTSITIDTGV